MLNTTVSKSGQFEQQRDESRMPPAMWAANTRDPGWDCNGKVSKFWLIKLWPLQHMHAYRMALFRERAVFHSFWWRNSFYGCAMNRRCSFLTSRVCLFSANSFRSEIVTEQSLRIKVLQFLTWGLDQTDTKRNLLWHFEITFSQVISNSSDASTL